MNHQPCVLLLSVFLILVFANLGRGLSYKFYLPMVAGEIFSGIVLGPTFFQWIDLHNESIMFVKINYISAIFNFLEHISLIFLVFTAGLEIRFDSILKYKKETIYVSLCSGLVPFIVGALTCNYAPHFFDIPNGPFSLYSSSLFFGLALSISALPVIYKILLENNLTGTSSGTIILSSAIIIDVLCCILFGLLLENTAAYNGIKNLFLLLLIILILWATKSLTRLKNLLRKNFFNKRPSLNSCFCMVFGLASLVEYLGLHSILGAFLAGVIIRSYYDNADIKKSFHHFVFSFFAPFFFVTIGLKINFLENFNNKLVVITLILATFSKILGTFLGTYFSKINGKDSLIISFALNARGLMEIIISSIALDVGLISSSMYVALIVMAVLTSSISGVVVRFITSYKIKTNFSLLRYK